MLDLDASRGAVPPRDAATLVLLRDTAGKVEVFCVERHRASAFMGGAVVFPGGKLDPSDRDAAWVPLATDPRPASFAPDAETLRALAIAACRETLEEAAMLPVTGGTFAGDELLALRARAAKEPGALRAAVAARGAKLDLLALHPLARWITPTAESRRYDTRFFAAVAPDGQAGAHDDRETTASFWATPAEVLSRFDAGRIQLGPPTHRTLWLLLRLGRASDLVELSAEACLDPICPVLVPHVDAGGTTVALVLPGDREHDVRVPRVAGPSRFVLRGPRWLPEDAPA